MEIRQLRVDEFESRVALSQFAFQYQVAPEQMEARRLAFRPEHDWGAFDEQGALMSALLLNPLEIWVQGKQFQMGGVAGVATWPEARRQGCVSKLLVHALETMRNNGQTVSMLHPFAFSFYRKYGYEMTLEYKQYKFEPHQLPSRTETPGQIKRMTEPNIELLNSIYTAYASRFNGPLVRTPEWWKDRVLTKTGRFAVYYSADNVPEGYVFYHVADKKLVINEWVSTNEVSRVALWTYISNHDSMVTEVIISVPIDDPLPFLLSDPRIKQEIVPYFMSRIVDAQGFVAQYPWAEGLQEEEVLLSLTDAHAPWNNGSYRLVWTAEGAGQLEALEDGVSTAEKDVISCDIQSLTAMLLGNRRPSFLLEVGRISGSVENVARLERHIPTKTTFLMDFF
ncbi:acetyltransferase [Cohnella abietis]|uniref:Acetyltransferase n=2 Tax=Cohnella abietis TaxID=2507935 RepID=A0A3T1CZE3_9BACL|nr:acetyltransferase [Cohnella abietis]